MEDYSNFSWERITEDVRKLYADVQRETGATDQEMRLAFQDAVERVIMDTDGFREPRRDERKEGKWAEHLKHCGWCRQGQECPYGDEYTKMRKTYENPNT